MSTVVDPPMTEDEEKIRQQRQEEDEQRAREVLDRKPGGIRPSRFRLQLTGGAFELPPSMVERFEKDAVVDVMVAGVKLQGWVKTYKDTTDSKGDSTSGALEVVVVVQKDDGEQLRLGEDPEG